MRLLRVFHLCEATLCRRRIIYALTFVVICTLCVLSWLPEPRNIIDQTPRNSIEPIKPYKNNVSEWIDWNSKGYLDDRAQYKIISYVVTAQNWTTLSQTPICAAVQSSLDRANLLPNFVASWIGPLSMAIFAPGPEFSLTLSFIKHLTFCYPDIRTQVSFHLIYPVTRPPPPHNDEETVIPLDDLHNCTLSPNELLQRLLSLRSNETIEWRDELLYPQNVLRNVARAHCQTEWITCVDIDMVFPPPSDDVTPSLMHQLTSLLTTDNVTSCHKCAFVLPVFELDTSVSVAPSNKTQLQDLKTAGKARQYHLEVFPPNQGQSHLNSVWLKLPPSEDVSVAYKIDKFEFWYEPVYIARRGVPKFDERYVGFGMVRNTQAYEMFLAGYRYYILDNIFLVHWGFQRKKVIISPSRLRETNSNYRRFVETHVRELSARYDTDPLGLLARYGNKKKHKVMIKLPVVKDTKSTALPKKKNSRKKRSRNVMETADEVKSRSLLDSRRNDSENSDTNNENSNTNSNTNNDSNKNSNNKNSNINSNTKKENSNTNS